MREDQATKLAAPFELHEHKFREGNVYISKAAIRRRLFEVDPFWTLSKPEVVSTEGDIVVLSGSLTVCGITRHAVGTGIIQRKSAGGKNELQDYALALMVAKAYKEAQSNILSRAAIQFNCGAYLIDLDKDDKPHNAEEVKRMLRKLTHWASQGGRERASEMMKVLGLSWSAIAQQIEPGRTLEAISETTLTEAEFMKRLVELSMKPAAPKADPKRLQPIDCPTNLLEEGDVVIMQWKDDHGGHSARFEVVKNFGKVSGQYKLDVTNLNTGKPEKVNWTGGPQRLIDGPKVKAYAADPSCCTKQAASIVPLWDRQLAGMQV